MTMLLIISIKLIANWLTRLLATYCSVRLTESKTETQTTEDIKCIQCVVNNGQTVSESPETRGTLIAGLLNISICGAVC